MLSKFCDIIILLGALAVATTNIYNFFIKPHRKLQNKRKSEIKIQIEEAFDEKMPEILLNHDLEVRKKYLSDRQQYLEDIKNEVLEDTKETFNKINALNAEQSQMIEVLVNTSKDILRQRIMTIYHEHKAEKRLPIHAKEALTELYKDYKAEKGNSYIDKYYNRMSTWEVYDDESYYQ